METKTYKLKDIAISIFDGVHNSVLDNENGDCFLLSAKNIKNGIISFDQTDRKIDKSTRDKLSKRTNLAKDDVLVTTVGTVGELAIVDENYQKYEFQRSVGIIKCNQEIVLPQYLYYLLKTESYNYYLHVVATGAAQPCIFLSTLKNIKVKLPNLHVQSDVLSVLSKYDKLINNYKEQIENLQNLASELYKEWFVRFRFPGYEKATFENGIPKGWKFEKLSCICSVTDGTHDSPKSVENGGVPLVTGKSVKNGEVDFSQTYNISIEDHEKIRKRSGLKTGDILFSNIGTVGNACIVNYDREFSVKNMIIFKPTNRDISLFLYYLLINEAYQNIFHAQTNGSTQQFLGLDFMRKFKILVPTQTLLSNFGQKSIDIYSQIQICRKKIENCTQQQSLLLPRLMSGKLEVK